MEEKKMISMDDAQKIAKDYIGRQISYDIESIVVEGTEVTEIVGIPIYPVEGKVTAIIKPEEKTFLKVIPAETEKYSFKVQVHAIDRSVIGHKLYQ